MKQTKLFIILLFILAGCRNLPQSTYVKVPQNPQAFFSPSNKQFPMVSVHRGGGEIENYPENCIESFEYFAKRMPSIIECDIVMSKDSILFMLHDNTLDRTTTGKGKVSEKSWSEIQPLQVKDNFGNVTPYQIPSLENTLLWGRNKVLFTLDVKKETPFEKVVEIIQKTKAQNYSVVITYNATDAKKVYDLDPSLMISVGIMQEADYYRLRDLGIPDQNMVAFIGTREPKKDLIDFLHSKGITTILGVLGNLDKKAEAQGDILYKNYIDLGVNMLSTDRPEAVYRIIKP